MCFSSIVRRLLSLPVCCVIECWYYAQQRVGIAFFTGGLFKSFVAMPRSRMATGTFLKKVLALARGSDALACLTVLKFRSFDRLGICSTT